jgi:hypothetical protein
MSEDAIFRLQIKQKTATARKAQKKLPQTAGEFLALFSAG